VMHEKIKMICLKWPPIIVFLAAIFLCSQGYAETITLRADIWCPYNCEPASDAPGFMVEIARQAFEKAGYSVDYQLLNWARAVEETRNGKYSGVIGAYKSDAPDFIFPDNEQGQAVDMFFTQKQSSWRYENISSLAGQSVGIIKDYSYGNPLDEYIKSNPGQFVIMHGADAFERNLNMLFLGRTTALVENKFVMNHYIQHHDVGDRIVEAGVTDIQSVYIAFSPQNPRSKEYAEILSNAMNDLRSSGELKKILDKYGLADWKQ
jgi:polar amino acid transport system substrate-binding protein